MVYGGAADSVPVRRCRWKEFYASTSYGSGTRCLTRSACIELPRLFARLKHIDDAISDESTILKFRRLLVRRALIKRMLEVINRVLARTGAVIMGGKLVDKTIVHASPFTKDRQGTQSADITD
jgi:hypothetical protein